IQYINWMMLNAQLQLELSPEFSSEGLAEVFSEIKHYLFNELHLHRLEARVCIGNTSVPEKLLALGFEKEGTLPSQFEYEGDDISLDIYSIISE
ncbi:MAG: GNAT family protein, partial [Thalassolituus sp.]